MTALERKTVDQLMVELQGQHGALRDQIANQFKRLTENDLRLCVMLNANMATKEIALLLNITPDSVKKAKHRLRKKLKMTPQTTWKAFFDRYH